MRHVAGGLILMLVTSGCTPSADVVLTGGRVWDGLAGEPMATAVAVRDGAIVAVGGDADVLALAGDGTERVDLAGRLVVPGFMDDHTHFLSGGFALASVQLRDATTPDAFIQRVAEFAAAHPAQWITGGSWDHEHWGGALPQRGWIDSVTGDTPVFVTRLDEHMALANSHVLALAGVTADTPDPEGGEIVRDASGEPTGILKDAAMDMVFAVMPHPSESEQDAALDAAAVHALERGVTHVMDMGSFGGLEAYRRAAAEGRLPLRVYAATPIAQWDRLVAYVAEHGRGDARLRWGAVKGFVDGSLGSTTAWFYDQYLDAPETSGLVITDTAQLREQILAADAAGLQVVVHAIGDRANDWLLDVFAEASARNGMPDPRFRIEHAQHLTPEAIRRFGATGVIASVQPYHAIDDGRWAANRIGDRIRTTYPFRSLLDAGAAVVFGSDWTVAPLDPLLGIYAALTRRTLDDANPDGWVPQEKITLVDALRAYTSANAYAAYRESDLGTLAVGMLADLVVLSEDLFAIEPVAIRDVRVDVTMVGGEIVYRR